MNLWLQNNLRPTLLVVLVAALCSFPTQVAAETDEDKARHHFEEGARQFFEGDFSGAVLEFRRAYQYQPDPMILYNLSLAHSRLGNHREALEAGIAATEMPGMPPQAQVRNDARVSALSVAISADQLTRRLERVADTMKTTEPVEDLRYIPHFEDETLFGPMGWAGVGATAFGVGLLSYALVVNQRLGADIEEYKAAQADGRVDDYYVLREHIESGTRTGKITLYSGVALASAGVGLLVYDLVLRDSSDYAFSVNLAPTSKTGMLRVMKRF